MHKIQFLNLYFAYICEYIFRKKFHLWIAISKATCFLNIAKLSFRGLANIQVYISHLVHISSNTHNKISKPLICQYDKLNIISKCDLDLFFIKNEFQLFNKMFIGLLHLYFNLIIFMNPTDFLLDLWGIFTGFFYNNLIIILIACFCTIKILLWLNAFIFLLIQPHLLLIQETMIFLFLNLSYIFNHSN